MAEPLGVYAGEPMIIKKAVCMHEEDYGTLWKHTEYRTGHSEVRRSRRLVLSFISTIANYEYGFYWYFYQVSHATILPIAVTASTGTSTRLVMPQYCQLQLRLLLVLLPGQSCRNVVNCNYGFYWYFYQVSHAMMLSVAITASTGTSTRSVMP